MKSVWFYIQKQPKLVLVGLVFVIFLAAAHLLVLERAMAKGYNRDENQFIASAYLLGTAGLLPYVDYPYFHTPNLVFVYAVLFKLIPYKLLAARYFSTLNATLLIAVLFWATFALFRRQGLLLRTSMAFCAALLLLANPLFVMAAGRAWNHDASILPALLAAIALVIGLQGARPGRWLFASGVLLGLAVGVRSIWAVTTPAFVLAVFLFNTFPTRRSQLKGLLWLGLGGALALLPSIVLFLMAPRQFVFGNLGYARLNTLFRQQTGYTDLMDLGSKLESFVNYSETGFLPFLILSVWMVYVLPLVRARRERRMDPVALFTMALLSLILIGALLPTPGFRQYFYAIVPFALLGVSYQTAEVTRAETASPERGWAVSLMVVVTLFSGIVGLRDYSSIWAANRLATWFPLQVHSEGKKIAAAAVAQGADQILTLAPMYVAEANGAIYPEFATGPFAWRTADLLPPAGRAAYRMVGPQDLAAFLIDRPPDAVLLGWEPDFEQPLRLYAEHHGYRQTIKISEKLELWLP